LLGKSVLDGEILPLDPAKLAEFLSQRFPKDRAAGSRAWIEDPYAKNFPRLLGLGRGGSCQQDSRQ
jgi:hypothetical protein